MGRLRVHELAKKLNMPNQDLITKLIAKGFLVKTHSSSVDEKAVRDALHLSNVKNKKIKHPKTILRRRSKKNKFIKDLRKNIKIKNNKTLNTVETINKNKKNITSSFNEIEPNKKIDKNNIKEVKPKNVIRIIDAASIRSRLAGERRNFQIKKQKTLIHQKPYERFIKKKNFNTKEISIREFKSNNISPNPKTLFNVKPSGSKLYYKKKINKDYNTKIKKETLSGGYDLWITPGKKKRIKGKNIKTIKITQTAAHKRIVELSGTISVNDLAHKMAIKSGQVVSKLMNMGMMVTVNQPIDLDTATLIAQEFNYEVKNIAFQEKDILKIEANNPKNMKKRSPIVTVMRHVDHGKTSILDIIKKTEIAKKESGGITQHIAAYSVKTKEGNITFLDTPGHKSFSAMRARGTSITDLILLVVAANDGVMPQTIEAINHAKAANVPIIVAINKIDIPNTKPEKIIKQLSEQDIISEEWGGNTQIYKVSALIGTGLNELLDGIVMQAEIMELKADSNKKAEGFILESKLDKGRGAVSTILIKSGTLKQGDYIIAGKYSGKIRAIYDSHGVKINEAGPSTPVNVLGITGVPCAGDSFNAVASDKKAKTIAAYRSQQCREKVLLSNSKITLENFLQSTPKDEKALTLRLILKGDVFGSVEALSSTLISLSTKKVKIKIIHSGVGIITENDVVLALASKAIIVGFNIKPDSKAQNLANIEKVDIRSYNVIYNVIEDIKNAMTGLLLPIIKEHYIGKAEIKKVITVPKSGQIAGSYVLDGKILKNSKAKILRNNKFITKCNIIEIKRFKNSIKEISSGYECGISFSGFNDIQEGDTIECFEEKKEEIKLFKNKSYEI